MDGSRVVTEVIWNLGVDLNSAIPTIRPRWTQIAVLCGPITPVFYRLELQGGTSVYGCCDDHA